MSWRQATALVGQGFLIIVLGSLAIVLAAAIFTLGGVGIDWITAQLGSPGACA